MQTSKSPYVRDYQYILRGDYCSQDLCQIYLQQLVKTFPQRMAIENLETPKYSKQLVMQNVILKYQQFFSSYFFYTLNGPTCH